MKSFKTFIQEKVESLHGGLGLPRNKCPQVQSSDLPDFFAYLQSNGIHYDQKTIAANSIQPIQKHVDDKRVGAITPQLVSNKKCIVSADHYLVDGHHRWQAALSMNPHAKIDVWMIQTNIFKLLDLMKSYPKVFYKSI